MKSQRSESAGPTNLFTLNYETCFILLGFVSLEKRQADNKFGLIQTVDPKFCDLLLGLSQTSNVPRVFALYHHSIIVYHDVNIYYVLLQRRENFLSEFAPEMQNSH